MARVLLALDLSTTATGYAAFSIETGALLAYGAILPNFKNPKRKGVPQYEYPKLQTLKIRELVDQVAAHIALWDPEFLVAEEVCRHKSRLTGKTLDGYHYLLADRIIDQRTIHYVDVSGSEGWRPFFGIRLSEQDKLLNKQTKAFNKKLKKGTKKTPVIDWKTLSARYVNKRFGLNLDPNVRSTDGDIADAIMVGLCYLEKTLHVKGQASA